MKHYILFGPPGAGKGTQAAGIAARYHLRHLSTGELLRAEIAAGTELGREAERLISGGNLVPDSVVEGMIAHALENARDIEGFLLDGFPRTLAQARDLDKMLQQRGEAVEKVISLHIPDEEVFRRIRRRAEIEGRSDDASDDTIRRRIETYHAQTEPLIDYYRSAGIYAPIDGLQDIDSVQKAIFSLLN